MSLPLCRVSSKTSIMPSGATQRSDTKVLSSLKRNAPGRWPIERHHACPSQRVQSIKSQMPMFMSTRRQEPGQCFANETAISNENKRYQSRAEPSGLSGFPGDRGSLITVRLVGHEHTVADKC